MSRKKHNQTFPTSSSPPHTFPKWLHNHGSTAGLNPSFPRHWSRFWYSRLCGWSSITWRATVAIYSSSTANKEVTTSRENRCSFPPKIGLRKVVMFLKGIGFGIMSHIQFMQKRIVHIWLNRLLARGMGGLTHLIRIGDGSLLHANYPSKKKKVSIFFF